MCHTAVGFCGVSAETYRVSQCMLSVNVCHQKPRQNFKATQPLQTQQETRVASFQWHYPPEHDP